MNNKENKKNIAHTKKNEILSWISSFLVAAVIFLIINTFCFVSRVSGLSMYPTYNDGDFLFTGRSQFTSIDRRDIIVFYSPKLQKHLIKRVIGLPEDKIVIENKNVIVNNKKIDEPYINNDTLGTYSFTVPQDSYFVMGDNRQNSEDSRFADIGFINKNDIKGKVILG